MGMMSKILVIVEGAKTDIKLMEHLLHIYGIDNNHEVVSYNTNIYVLYNQMFANGDPYSIDLLQLLKERESDPDKKEVLNDRYSDIILVFDLDPQDSQFSGDKILEMMSFFTESSDMGKLYVNYPMVEAFYHMKSIPDENYINYIVSLDELFHKEYKRRVNLENRNHDYSKFAVSKGECNMIIRQNIEKAWNILKIEMEKAISVLCTCAFYIVDYNPKFITD